jgi:hypothetical protein
MKKTYYLLTLLLTVFLGNAQIVNTTYRGAFAPAPAAMWTDNWANFDPQNTVYPTGTVDVTTNITTDTHWTACNTYYLRGQIYVKNNATLTIDPGVIIRGDHTATGAGLFITKGAKLNAVGTATSPIVFTSDNAPGARNKGDWGGVILLGKASYNINNGINNIEGIAASADTEYGGGATPDDTDNSGILKYVRIEFAGYVYGPNQEINGLTFGAVGSGTTIDYVQVSHSNDDSFEWFGGSVNCKHLIAFRGLDDDFDTDNGFSGNVQFILGVRDPQVSDNPSVSTSEGFESDNNATSSAVSPYTSAIFSNCTMVGPTYRLSLPNGGTLASGYKRAARLRRNTQLKIYNSLFLDYLEGLHIDGATTEANATAGSLKWKNNILAGIATPAKTLQVNTGSTFDITTWYNANNNTTVTASAGILTNPYDATNATTYTGLDYRPATSSIAASGADFSDAPFAGLVQYSYFVDADADGYDNGTALLSATTAPAGYSATSLGSDCDDTNAAYHSNCPVITNTVYRGAFAPAPAAMWTDNWANFDPQNTVYPTGTVDVTTNITTDTHWTACNTYYLRGQIYVKNNATLTIDPGVIIRGDHTATGAGLFITKGAKLNAVGTATSPIVFTSDNAPGARNKGDWGGVILLGKASYNINNGINNIEGIAASADTEYGGGATPDDTDNSGILKYVRIEFAGYVYGPNQEINGLTFGAVGSGTTIDYVQVSHSNDDSFEWFGGSVNCKHLIAFRGLDDDFDTDNGFSGNVQFILGVRDPQVSDNPSVSTSEGFESDNNATSSAVSPYTSAIFSNCTMVGPTYRLSLPNGGTLASGYKRAARLRRNTQLKVINSLFMDYLEGLHIDGATTEANATAGSLKWKNNILAGIATPAKTLQVNTGSTFDITTWYNANNNTTVTASAGILINPYDATNATTYTGLDYRPAVGSIAATGADFNLANDTFATEAEMNLVIAPNPFGNNFKLYLTSPSSEDVNVGVYDMTGRLIEMKKVEFLNINNQEFGNEYNAGVYIVVVKQGDFSKSFHIIKK